MSQRKHIETLKARLDYLLTKEDSDLFASVFKEERNALVWALRVLEGQDIYLGDRVRLYVSEDPEDGEQPETGVIIGYADGGHFLVRPESGEYSDTTTGLWYDKRDVELLEEEG